MMFRGIGQNDLILEPETVLPQPPEGSCVTDEAARMRARSLCSNWAVRGLGAPLVDPSGYDPCAVARLPLCAPPAPPAPPQYVPQDVPSTSSEDNSWAVGGLLALLVLGGIGYAAFRSEKKRKGKKGRR